MDRLPPLQWSLQSVALTLANKAVFSNALFDFPWIVLAVQSCTVVVSVIVVVVFSHRRQLNLSLPYLREMLPCAILFLFYQYSYARALRFISLPAYTVVKSVAPLAVTLIESICFRESIPLGVYFALFIAFAANALTFDFSSAVSLVGYAWALFHVLAHVFYVLSLRSCSLDYFATDKALLANLLSLPFLLLMSVLNFETSTFVVQVELLPSLMLWPLACSFGLSAGCAVAVLAAYEVASANMLRYLALSNKVAVVSLGALLFSSGLTKIAWIGVALSILSGFIFVYSKTKFLADSQSFRPIVSSPSLEMLLPTDEQHHAPSPTCISATAEECTASKKVEPFIEP